MIHPSASRVPRLKVYTTMQGLGFLNNKFTTNWASPVWKSNAIKYETLKCSILPVAGFRAFGYLDWGCVTGEIYTYILKCRVTPDKYYAACVLFVIYRTFFGSRPYKWVVTAELLKFSAVYKQGKGHYDCLKLILHNWILCFHFIDYWSFLCLAWSSSF